MLNRHGTRRLDSNPKHSSKDERSSLPKEKFRKPQQHRFLQKWVHSNLWMWGEEMRRIPFAASEICMNLPCGLHATVPSKPTMRNSWFAPNIIKHHQTSPNLETKISHQRLTLLSIQHLMTHRDYTQKTRERYKATPGRPLTGAEDWNFFAVLQQEPHCLSILSASLK